MLLIAQPKTASTSLMVALGKITGLESLQKLRLPYEKHPDWKILTHSDMRVVPNEILYNWIIDKDRIYKQHILPINRHLEILLKAKANYVVLLREPKETFKSYAGLASNSKMKKSIQKEGEGRVLKELQLWHDRAIKIFSGDHFLHIWFDDLVNNSFEIVNTILEFYGFQERVDKNFILPKERYTKQ